MSVNLLYAVTKNGETVHISEVQRGGACGCVCPACGDELIARKGSEVKHHFAHTSNDRCENGFTASVCLAFKRAIDRQGFLCLPAYMKNRSVVEGGSGVHVIIPESKIQVSGTAATKRAGAVTGLMTYFKAKPLIITVLTSYSTKKAHDPEKIKAIGIPVIEIDLSREKDINDSLICDVLLGKTDLVYWIYNGKADGIWSQTEAKCTRLGVSGEENAVFTMGCPIAGNRIDGYRCYIKSKCAYCPFFFGMYGFGEERYLLCGRQNMICEAADIKLTLAQRKEKYAKM